MQELFPEGVFLVAFVYVLNSRNVQASGCPLPNFVDPGNSLRPGSFFPSTSPSIDGKTRL